MKDSVKSALLTFAKAVGTALIALATTLTTIFFNGGF